MPTLQGADLNHFKPAAEAPVHLSHTTQPAEVDAQTEIAVKTKKLRGYFALITLFMISGSGYVLLFKLLDYVISSDLNLGG
ncbi:hypothetical protein [Pelagibius sp. Alg239-R121]|uniref:hypothetical protein n=1 Tax=Pelagibius sp. Alg239-R121 TaxID=2993448 RepID=UPI0024A708BB|nr:hypothetical protein [Pelagibius sp. Alg239-R121]